MSVIFNPMHNPQQPAAQAPASKHGYLQHGQGADGPFCTERVEVLYHYAAGWRAWFEYRWRKVHIQVNRTFIVYRGERITIQIDGV